MEKIEAATHVPVNLNDAVAETAEENSIKSILALYIRGKEEPILIPLTLTQTYIAMHSLMKKADSRVVMFTDDELMNCRDMEKPLNRNLFSIKQAGKMLSDKQICGVLFYFQPENEDDEPLQLKNSLQAAVILARLGIDLETECCASDTVLDVIYGAEWDPELVAGTSAVSFAIRPQPKKNIKAGILTPKQVKKLMDKTIIGQDSVKEKLATVVYEQDLAVRYNVLHKHDKNFVPMKRQSILLYGASGSGKTALLQKLGDVTGRPVVSCDVTTLVPSGYEGKPAVEPVRELLRKCGNDTEKAARGIVCLDNADQIFCNSAEESLSPHKVALRNELLGLVNGCKLSFGNIPNQEVFDTSGILFVFGGKFAELDSIVMERITGKKRDTRKIRGFVCGEVCEHVAPGVKPEALSATLPDLMKCGMPTVMLEQITAVCRTKELDQNDLADILALSDRSPVEYYRQMLQLHNVTLKVTRKALEAAAEKALEQNMGAYSLASVFDKVMAPVIFQVAGNRKRLMLHLQPECFTADKVPELVPCKAG